MTTQLTTLKQVKASINLTPAIAGQKVEGSASKIGDSVVAIARKGKSVAEYTIPLDSDGTLNPLSFVGCNMGLGVIKKAYKACIDGATDKQAKAFVDRVFEAETTVANLQKHGKEFDVRTKVEYDKAGLMKVTEISKERGKTKAEQIEAIQAKADAQAAKLIALGIDPDTLEPLEVPEAQAELTIENEA